MKIFISHCSNDVKLAGQLIELMLSALRLEPEDIRCTSVDGFRMKGGVDSDETLRKEVLEAPVFIGLISQDSIKSIYVLFELGARWGAKLKLVPLLAPGLSPSALEGPLSGLNALSCSSRSQLHQLMGEISEILGVEKTNPEIYEKYIDRIKSIGGSTEPIEKDQLPIPDLSSGQNDEYANAEEIIDRHCEQEWPDDYSMRAYCLKEQREALEELKRHNPTDIPGDVFNSIRAKAAAEWPNDFSMRLYMEKEQVESYREIYL